MENKIKDIIGEDFGENIVPIVAFFMDGGVLKERTFLLDRNLVKREIGEDLLMPLFWRYIDSGNYKKDLEKTKEYLEKHAHTT
jgi:hypothetical protein